MAARPTGEDDASSIKDAVSCVDAFNAVFFCASPGHQFDRYYKDGGVDGCDKQLADMKLCLKLKLSGPEDTKRLLTSLLLEEAAPPSSGRVWELHSRRRDGREGAPPGAGGHGAR